MMVRNIFGPYELLRISTIPFSKSEHSPTASRGQRLDDAGVLAAAAAPQLVLRDGRAILPIEV